ENLRFAEHALESGCDEDLADLALIGDVVSDQQILGHLLRDGRAALRPSGLRQISDERPDHSALVNTLVLEEPLLLRRHEAFFDELRDLSEWHGDAALIGCGHGGKAGGG